MLVLWFFACILGGVYSVSMYMRALVPEQVQLIERFESFVATIPFWGVFMLHVIINLLKPKQTQDK